MEPNYYAIIPANVRYDKELNANAKLLYGEITALCNEKGYCWATNEYFANLYGVSKTSISKWISLLIDKGYIFSKIIYKENTKEILNRYLTIVNDPIEEKLNRGIEEKLKDNNTYNNNTNNKKEIYKEKRFIEPTLEEIEDYCRERNNNINAKKFYDYYSINDWKDIKGNKIKNWKQKIITWEGRNTKDIKQDMELPTWFDKDIQQDTTESEDLNELKDFFKGGI